MNIDPRMAESMMLGLLIGIAFGFVLDNLAIWMSIGFAMGVFYWVVRYQRS